MELGVAGSKVGTSQPIALIILFMSFGSTQFIISNLIATPTTIYLIGLEKSTSSHTLHITALSATTGEVVATTRVPSNIAHGLNDIIALSHANASSADPVVAWLQQGVLFSFTLTPKLKGKPSSIKGSAYKSLMDVGLRDHGQFIAVKPDGSTRAFKLGTGGPGISSFWDFADSVRFACYVLTRWGI
jgi:hypothetical protein